MRYFYFQLKILTSRVGSYSTATAHVQNCLNPSPSAQSHPIPEYRSSVTPMLGGAPRQLDRTTQVALTVDHLTSQPALRRRRLPSIEISAPPATTFAETHTSTYLRQCCLRLGRVPLKRYSKAARLQDQLLRAAHLHASHRKLQYSGKKFENKNKTTKLERLCRHLQTLR